MHFSANIGPNTAKKEFAMLNALFSMPAPATQPEPAPSKNHINTAILSSVRAAAIDFGAASQSRHSLKDIVRLLIDFEHFRTLCEADLKSAFHEQRQAQAATLLAKEQGREARPNRIVRNRKGCWETLFRYFARHARLDADVHISADGHQGDYTCELVARKKRESVFEKFVQIGKELGISRGVIETVYVNAQVQALAERGRSMEDRMADSPDESDATASAPDAAQAASAPQDNIEPDDMQSIADDAQQTSSATPESSKQNNTQLLREEDLQVLEKIARSGSKMAAQARTLLDQAKQTARRIAANPAAPGAHHATMQTASQERLSQPAQNNPHVWTRQQNGPANAIHRPGH